MSSWPAQATVHVDGLEAGNAATALVGAVVAEITKSEDGGLGARLLAGSYYGQTIQIWAALLVAASVAALLVVLVGVIERATGKMMGARP